MFSEYGFEVYSSGPDSMIWVLDFINPPYFDVFQSILFKIKNKHLNLRKFKKTVRLI